MIQDVSNSRTRGADALGTFLDVYRDTARDNQDQANRQAQLQMQQQYQAARMAMMDRDAERADLEQQRQMLEFQRQDELTQQAHAERQQYSQAVTGQMRRDFNPMGREAIAEAFVPGGQGLSDPNLQRMDSLGRQVEDFEALAQSGAVSPDALAVINQELQEEAGDAALADARANFATMLGGLTQPRTLQGGLEAPPVVDEQSAQMMLEAMDAGMLEPAEGMSWIQKLIGASRESDKQIQGVARFQEILDGQPPVAADYFSTYAKFLTPPMMRGLERAGNDFNLQDQEAQAANFFQSAISTSIKEGMGIPAPQELEVLWANAQAASGMMRPTAADAGPGQAGAQELDGAIQGASSLADLDQIASQLGGELSREELGHYGKLLGDKKAEIEKTIEGQREIAEEGGGVFQEEKAKAKAGADKAADIRIKEEKTYQAAVKAVSKLPKNLQGFDAGPISWMKALERTADEPQRAFKLIEWAKTQPGFEELVEPATEYVSSLKLRRGSIESTGIKEVSFLDVFGKFLQGIDTQAEFEKEQAARSGSREISEPPKVLPEGGAYSTKFKDDGPPAKKPMNPYRLDR